MQSRKKKKNGLKSAMVAVIAILLVTVIGCVIYEQFMKPKEFSVSTDIYFLESSSSLMKTEKREITGEENVDILASVLTELKTGPKTEGYVGVVPKNVNFESANIDNGVATINISPEYSQMKAGEELLCRASIVWTLTGLDFVDYVKITIDGKELTKTNGEPIGAMSRDDIVIDAVIPPEPINREIVKLYFSNEQATGLEVEEREIEVNPNQPLEKYIVEQLIAGPSTGIKLYATVPSETKIRDIKTVDGICYLDLSNEFVTKHAGGSTGEILTVYSIVNSLTELESIKKVQFLIEGEKVADFKGHIDFSKPFEAKIVDV